MNKADSTQITKSKIEQRIYEILLKIMYEKGSINKETYEKILQEESQNSCKKAS